MNVEKIKHISKRSISMLLSVLMVLSLFTVCMVGTTVSVAADFNNANITVTLTGNALTWEKVYLIIGRDDYHSSIELDPLGNNVYGKAGFTYNKAKWYFFSNLDCGSNNTGMDEIRNGLDPYNKTEGRHDFSSNINISIDAMGKEKEYAWFDATLWNYRNQAQIDAGSDYANGQANIFNQFYVYSAYNEAVADWFRSQDTDPNHSATPLYQGNFREHGKGDTTDDPIVGYGEKNYKGTVGYMLSDSGVTCYNNKFYNFVSMANGTNRLNAVGDGDNSTCAVALNLLDKQLNEFGNPTQNGIEIPQFSDAFMEAKNKDKIIQTKYDNLKFQFVKEIRNGSGNTWYSYDASEDGNRKLNIQDKKLEKGPDVHGCTGGKAAGKKGYFPFNSTDPTDDYSKIVNCFGNRINVNFAMPSKAQGYMYHNEELLFNFEGDDDVWVYIDGYLALDLGGAHNNASGSLNLTSGKYTLKSGYYDATYGNLKKNNAEDYQYACGGSTAVGYNGFDKDGKGYTPQTFDLSDELLDSLHDTSKQHTMTIFYLERGTFDSNFKMEFMLPVSNTLNVKEEIDSSKVNKGLLEETLAVANEDVFSVALKSDSPTITEKNVMAKFTDKNIKMERKSPDGSKTVTLQNYNNGEKPDGPFKNDSTDLISVNAYYAWTDTATDLNDKPLTTGEGVGVPENGKLRLNYGQNAGFFDQFKVGSNLYIFQEQEIQNWNDEADNNGILTSLDSTRRVEKYYDTEFSAKDVDNADLEVKVAEDNTTNKGGFIKFQNETDGSNVTTVNAVIKNIIKTANFDVKKSLEKNSESLANTDKTYTFTVECEKLFGKAKTSQELCPKLFYELYNVDESGNETPVNGTYSTDINGQFRIKANQVAKFKGIPVDSKFKVTESEEDSAKNKDFTVKIGEVAGKVYYNENKKNTAIIEINDTNEVYANFKNDYKKQVVPVLYRFIDRKTTTGMPTELEDHYTYFVKFVEGNLITTDEKDKSKKKLADNAKELIINSSVNIDNILQTYTLNDASNYDIESLKTVNDSKAGGLTESLAAIRGKGYSDETSIIIATYDQEIAKYPVTAYYYSDAKKKDADGKDTNEEVGFKSNTVNNNFNELVNLNTFDAAESFERNGKEYVFAYWEREVTVRNGDKAETCWTPVSSNFNYAYRITDVTTIRAVYYTIDPEKDSNGDPILDNGKTIHYSATCEEDINKNIRFIPMKDDNVGDKNWIKTTYKKTYHCYWEKDLKGNIKFYDKNYTAVLKDEKGNEITDKTKALEYAQAHENEEGFCTKEPVGKSYGYYNPSVGNGASATDRTYDNYSTGVNDRTRFNVVFGAAGSPDNDTNIKKIGYILIMNEGSYVKADQGELQEVAESGQISKLTTLPNGTKAKIRTYNAAGMLTSKNRCQFVFDILNDETTQNDYYTCYTVMMLNDGSNGDKWYVSGTPANFSPSEAKIYDFKANTQNKSYYINITNKRFYDKTTTGVLGKVTCDYSVATEGKPLTFYFESLPNVNNSKMGVLKKLSIGNHSILEEDKLKSISTTTGYVYYFKENECIEEIDRKFSTLLNIEAEIDEIDAGIPVTREMFEVGTNAKVESISFTTSDSVKHTYTIKNIGDIIPYNTTITVTAKEDDSAILNDVDGFTNGIKQVETETKTVKQLLKDLAPKADLGLKVNFEKLTGVDTLNVIDVTENKNLTSGTVLRYGSTIKVQATAAEGYKLENSEYEAGKIFELKAEKTQAQLNEDLTVRAIEGTYTLTLKTDVGAKITAHYGGQDYTATADTPAEITIYPKSKPGEKVSITYTTDDGYSFINCTSGGVVVNIDNPLEVTSNYTLKANIQAPVRTVRFNLNGQLSSYNNDNWYVHLWNNYGSEQRRKMNRISDGVYELEIPSACTNINIMYGNWEIQTPDINVEKGTNITVTGSTISGRRFPIQQEK